MAKETEDTAPETTDEESPDEPEEHAGITLSGLADKVDALVDKVASLAKGGSPKGSRADDSELVADQVRTEVGKIKADEDRRKGREDRLGNLETAVKKLTERPPREYRRITTLIWGEDEADDS